MAYSSAKTRDLFKALHDLHTKQSGTPKNASPETVSWLIREIRDELEYRGFSESSKDVFSDRHSFNVDPTAPVWISVYPLTDIDPRETRDRVVELFRLYYVKRCESYYDCSGEIFTDSFHVFKRHGAWWVYEQLATDV